MTSKTNSVVAVFETHDQAEEAIRELQKDGFNIKQISIVGKDIHTEEHVVGYYNTCDRMSYWGKLGAFWGGFWGLLFGSAFFLKVSLRKNFKLSIRRLHVNECPGRCFPFGHVPVIL